MIAQTSSQTAVVTLPNDEQILITREFAAAKHLVYQAYTTPELVKRWWHAGRGEMTVAEIDLRVGGRWRFVMVIPNEQLVSTEVFEAMPDGESVNTVTFSETNGRTTMTMLVQHSSKADRDAHINSGMEAGMQTAMDLLEQIAVSLG
jgi:uncharacterized protein YndB with AHSA1/START domain